jgi:hypothetical protein
MRKVRHLRCLTVLALSLGTGGVAAAQSQVGTVSTSARAERPFTPSRFFLEVTGDWGLQFGTQSYVPAGSVGASENPLTNGPGFGATAGYAVTHDLEVLVDYAHGQADSRNGELMGALTSVDGSITFDTLAAGARLARHLGPGRLYGQLAVGVILPTETVLTYEYAPSLEAIGITGSGTRTERYRTGFGAHAEFGYHVPITAGLYVGASLRLQAFQTSNDGKKTSYDNFVTDFRQPVPVNMDIVHGTTNAETPTTYSVQDARLHVALGYDF